MQFLILIKALLIGLNRRVSEFLFTLSLLNRKDGEMCSFYFTLCLANLEDKNVYQLHETQSKPWYLHKMVNQKKVCMQPRM